jgi:hypothetical protein
MQSWLRDSQFLDRYPLRVGAALVAAAALGGAVYRLPALARAGHRYLNQPSRSVDVADLDPVRFFAQIGVVLAARGAIPPGSTYTVALGRYVAPSTTVILREELLPLRYTPKLRDAQYVIAYDRDPKTIRVRYSKSADLTWPAQLLEVKR